MIRCRFRDSEPVSDSPRTDSRFRFQYPFDFLDLGEGARLWLVEAGATGTVRIKVKMADAVSLARLHGAEAVDVALGQAALYGRFAEGDLASFLAAAPRRDHHSASEDHSLQGGTSAWKGFGT